jgi:hypothetical protein
MGADQERGTLPAPGGVATASADTDAADLFGIIASHLGAALGDPARVAEAFARLEAVAGDAESWNRHLVDLGSLLRNTGSRAAPSLFRLLASRALSLDRPAPLLQELLAARAKDLRAEAVVLTMEAVSAGSLPLDLDVAVDLAVALRDGGGQGPAGLAEVLAQVSDVRLPLARGDPLGRLLEPSVPLPLRLLAARLLDATGEPAPEDRIRRVLGSAAFRVLEHYLAFTRATHADLVALTPGPAPRIAALESIMASEAVLGRGRLADILARLGWARVADQLVAEPVTVLALDGGFPLVVGPLEAKLLGRCGTISGLWTGWLVTACGTEEATPMAAPVDADRIARFRRLSLEHAVLLGEILEVVPVTAARARRIIEHLDRVVEDHVALFAEYDPEAADVPARYRTLREAVSREVDEELSPEAVLPTAVAYQIQGFQEPASIADVGTLHGLKRYLHQRGLRHAFRLFGSGGAANRTVDLILLRDGHPPVVVQRIRYLDFEEQEGPGLPLAVRLVVDSYKAHVVHGITSLPTVRILVYGTEVQFYVSFQNHPAFIRLDLSPPRRGGMIDVEYYAVSQYELEGHPDLGVSGIQHVLRRLGFFVNLDGTRLRARYDKERALELSDIVEKADRLFRLMPHLMELDWKLATARPRPQERVELAAGWADFLECHGLIPPGDEELPAPAPARLGARLRRQLSLAGIEPHVMSASMHRPVAGQLDLERAVLNPLRAAVTRGEVVVEGDRFRAAVRDRYRREHEAVRFARLLAGRSARLDEAMRTAALLAPLERWLRFHPSGAVQGYPVERTTLALRDGTMTVAVLRDGRGVARLAFAWRGEVGYRVRDHHNRPWRRPADLALNQMVQLLVRDNYRSPDQELPVVTDTVAGVRALFSAPCARPVSPPLPGDRSVAALPAAPGKASGILRMAQPGRQPEDFDGSVFCAPAIEPSDAPRLARSVAAISTGGGTLSHIGLLAQELGKPAVVVEGVWPETGPGDVALRLRWVELRERTRQVRGLAVRGWFRLREHELEVRDGDLVMVDAEAGMVSVLGSDREALVLHHGFRDLEAASRALAGAEDDASVLEARGCLLRATHQLERAMSRLERPVLARFAVQELLAGQAAPGAGPATRQRRSLLDSLCQSPRLAAAARSARQQATDALATELGVAVRRAEAVIPLLTQPLPVLFVRLRAARLGESLRAVLEMDGSLPDSHHHDLWRVLDGLASHRLEEIRADLLEELGALAREGTRSLRLPFILRALGWIDEAAPPDATPAEAIEASQWLLNEARSLVGAATKQRSVTAHHRYTVRWDELGPGTESVAGRKATVLAEVARLLSPAMVPPWFVITDHAFRAALDVHVARPRRSGPVPLRVAIDDVLSRADLELTGKSARIRELWLDMTLPAELEQEVLAHYDHLDPAGGASPAVAIRSSAAEEDDPDATWAGQFDTFLHVTDGASVLRHVRLAWAALWCPRALFHRGHSGGTGPTGGGIMVQRMVNARVSGVVVTVDTVAGEMLELVVNAGLGLGEGVVSGTVGADEIHVARNERRGAPLQIRYRVADKREQVVFDTARGTGSRRVETRFHQRLRPALEYTELELLVETALELERAFGEPLDLEFALEDSALRILQARPLPLFRTALRETVRRYPLKENMA